MLPAHCSHGAMSCAGGSRRGSASRGCFRYLYLALGGAPSPGALLDLSEWQAAALVETIPVVGFAALVAAAAVGIKGPIAGLLTMPAVLYLGRTSYGSYLYHLPVMAVVLAISQHVGDGIVKGPVLFLIASSLTVLNRRCKLASDGAADQRPEAALSSRSGPGGSLRFAPLRKARPADRSTPAATARSRPDEPRTRRSPRPSPASARCRRARSAGNACGTHRPRSRSSRRPAR